MEIKDPAWLELETETSKFKDERLNIRFKSLIGQMWTGIGKSIPFACQDWANTKAAYRFFKIIEFQKRKYSKVIFNQQKIVVLKRKVPYLFYRIQLNFLIKGKNQN